MEHSTVIETEAGEIETPPMPWWSFLITGIISILLALVVLRFDVSSVTTVGILIGIVFLMLGCVDLFAAFVDRRHRWVHGILGGILVIGGVLSIFNPAGTFFALSQIVGFLFVLMGTFRIIQAFMLRDLDDLWWLSLISGILLLLLGFWAGGRFFAGAALILVWVGFGLLIRGFGQIVLAFSLRRLTREG
jgi:uncharacterized membrane protein HdeD (DUF308 family)